MQAIREAGLLFGIFYVMFWLSFERKRAKKSSASSRELNAIAD